MLHISVNSNDVWPKNVNRYAKTYNVDSNQPAHKEEVFSFMGECTLWSLRKYLSDI